MRAHPSYTSISTYLQCPMAFKLGFLDNEPAVVPPHVRRGQELHAAIATYAAHCWREQRASDYDEASVIALAYPGCDDLFAAFVENTRFDWGATIIRDVEPVEQHLQAALPDGTIFSGHVDLIQRYEETGSSMFGEDDAGVGDGCLWVITDWKSDLPGSARSDDCPLQLQIYAWLVQRNWPEARDFRLQMQSVRTGRVAFWAIGGDLRYIADRLMALCDRIAHDTDHEPICSLDSCPNCFYIHACPLRDTLTIENIAAASDEDLARAALWHRAAYREAWEALKYRAEAAGGLLTVGDQQWGWTNQLSLVPRNYQAVAKACVEAGRSLTELMSGFDKRKVTRAIKDGWLSPDLFEETIRARVFGPLRSDSGGDADGGDAE